MLENIGNAITPLAIDLLGRNLSGRIPSRSRHVKMGLPWQLPLFSNGPSNSALGIQQLWASGGRTREPILMEFGIQQQIRTTVTVM